MENPVELDVRCPVCDERGVEIVYGLPTDKTLRRAQRGEVVLGGCMLTRGAPAWSCRNCDHRWGDAYAAIEELLGSPAAEELLTKT